MGIWTSNSETLPFLIQSVFYIDRSQRCRTPCPSTCPLPLMLFSTRIFFIFPPNQAKGGAWSGEQDTGCWSPRGLSIDRHSEWTLACPSAAVLRTAVPTHGRGVNTCQAPWASGSGRARRGQRVARPTSPPWASSPPLPLLSTELPVWDNLGFFFWGIVLLHDPS